MEFRLLGEVELRAGGQILDVGAPRLQAVLAALAVDPGRPVAIETLIDRVWDDTPPVEARNVLYSYLSRIRRLLKQASLAGEVAARIERRPAGYVLDIDPELVDLHRFRRLVERDGGRECDDGARSVALAEALGLWRGPALAGLPGKWAAQVRDSWYRRRLDAVVQWAQVKLRLGHSAAVITTLSDLVAEYPLVEPLETLLMQALHRAGRRAEALERYSAIRRRLADELGADPGPELWAVHQTVLRGDLPSPPTRAVAAARTGLPATVPAPSAASNTAEAQHGPDLPSAGSGESPTAGKLQPLEASSGCIDGAVTNTPSRRPRSRRSRRRTVLAAPVAVILLAAAGSVPIVHRTPEDSDSLPIPPSIERVQALFATAQKLDQEGRTKDARETTVDAVQLYGDLIKLNPDRNAPPLAPALIQALDRAGVIFSVAETALRSWLADPVLTPYPAISQALLLQGWRFKAPVNLDVIVWNYEHAPGVTSPRDVIDVSPDVLKAAILEGSNSHNGTQETDFKQLLKP
jgi:DNA-binding SARP family transcriptional activator